MSTPATSACCTDVRRHPAVAVPAPAFTRPANTLRRRDGSGTRRRGRRSPSLETLVREEDRRADLLLDGKDRIHVVVVPVTPSRCRDNVSSAGASTGEPITWWRPSSRGDLRRHVVDPRDARLAEAAARVGRRVRPGPAHADGACGPEPREPHAIDATSSLSRVSSTAWRRANLGAGRGGRCRATAPTPSRARAHAHRTRLLRPWTARVFVDGFESVIVLDVSYGGSIARTLAGAAAGWPTALTAARVQVQVLRRSGSMADVNRGAVIKGARCRERVMQRCTLPGLCQQQQQALHKSSAARAVPGSDSLQHERLRGASPLQ